MTIPVVQDIVPVLPHTTFSSPPHSENYECELTSNCPVIQLREALAREGALLQQKDELIQQLEVLSEEADHRMMNGLQMVVSLLSLQSREVTNPEAASILADAADRVAMIERVQWRLHRFDGTKTVAFKQYLEDLCRDFSKILLSEGRSPRHVLVEGIEIRLPTGTAMSLGFIVTELMTNAVKYGEDRIVVTLQRNPEGGYALSVSNDGPGLPDGFDPATNKGLGLKIIKSYIGRIGGELRFGRGDQNQGVRFTVLFA